MYIADTFSQPAHSFPLFIAAVTYHNLLYLCALSSHLITIFCTCVLFLHICQQEKRHFTKRPLLAQPKPTHQWLEEAALVQIQPVDFSTERSSKDIMSRVVCRAKLVMHFIDPCPASLFLRPPAFRSPLLLKQNERTRQENKAMGQSESTRRESKTREQGKRARQENKAREQGKGTKRERARQENKAR